MKTNAERMQRVMVCLGVVCLGLVPLGPLSAQQPKERATLKGPKGVVYCVAFSPDGKTLASAHPTTGEVKLWDVGSGKNTATLKAGESSSSCSLAFSPDGKTLATAGANIILWDVATGKAKATFQGLKCVAFSPDGKTLAFLGKTGIEVVDFASGKLILSRGEGDDVISLAFSPDGKTLAAGAFLKKLKLWDVASGKESVTALDHTGVTSVAYSRDGNTLASGSLESAIKLWDVASGKNTATLKGHTSWVMSVVFSPDGKTVASAGWVWGAKEGYPVGGELMLWDVATGENTATFQSSTSFVHTVAFSPDGKTLASGHALGSQDGNGTIKLWDMPVAKKADK